MEYVCQVVQTSEDKSILCQICHMNKKWQLPWKPCFSALSKKRPLSFNIAYSFFNYAILLLAFCRESFYFLSKNTVKKVFYFFFIFELFLIFMCFHNKVFMWFGTSGNFDLLNCPTGINKVNLNLLRLNSSIFTLTWSLWNFAEAPILR